VKPVSDPRTSRDRPAALRYGAAVLLVGAAILFKWALDRLIRVETPFLLCFASVMVAAYYGGLGPGLLATLLSAVLTDVLWFRSSATPAAGGHAHTIIFAVEGALISLICGAMHLARRRATARKAETEAARAELRVSEDALRGSRAEARSLGESLARSEAEARDRDARELGIIEEVKDYAIFLAGPDGAVTTWNAGARRTFGYAEAEIVGRNARVLFTSEDQSAGVPEEELETARRDGRASDDRWMMRKDGSRFYAGGVTTALRDPDGNVRGFTKVLRDLTERQRHEQERDALLAAEHAARAEAEAANHVKDEFLAVVSHELRTPLAAILLWSKMLQARHATMDPELAEGLATIVQSAKAQQHLIEDLLDLSRMMSGRLRMNVRDTELVPVVQAGIEAVRPMAEARGLAINADLDERAGVVRADPDRIQQVLWNLLSNAVKFTDRGGRVGVRLVRLDDHVRIEVNDTGQGIAPQFLPHLFDRFRQEQMGPTRNYGGLGLGLAIARQLVQLHGGTIAAESAGEGRGATFTVELPLADLRPPAAGEATGPGRQPVQPLAPTSPRVARPSAVLSGVRVLLVEDDTATRRVMQWALEQYEASVTAAASADEALAAVAAAGAGAFDVVLSDIAMPGKDGYALLREVRASEAAGRPRVPAIAFTAYAREDDKARALAAGFQRHLPKPVEPGQLVAAILEVLGRDGAAAG
jgi:PAS domain S-box-containing protein